MALKAANIQHRYRLSFTVGGLLATQGRTLAEMYLKHVSDNGGQPDPNRENRELNSNKKIIIWVQYTLLSSFFAWGIR